MDATTENRTVAGPSGVPPSVPPPPPPIQSDRIDRPELNGHLVPSHETDGQGTQKMELDGEQKPVVSVPAKEESLAVNGKRSASPPLPSAKEEGSTSASGASTPALKGSESPLQSRNGKKGARKAAVRAEIQYIDGLRECTEEVG